jgi:gliding motility-associated-like protein
VYDFLESEGCPYQATLEFTIHELPEVTQQFEEISCFDQTTTTLEIIPSGGSGNYTITINGNNADLLNDVTAGNYDIVVTDDNLCTATSNVSITAPAEPTPTISGSTQLILGDSSTYAIQSNLFNGTTVDSIIWTANGTVVCNDATCFSLGNQSPTETTVYDVTVFFNSGCAVSATLTVEVIELEPPSIVEFPNIISPNNDGENDEWQIFSNDEEVVINSISIFDRWGNQVWGYEGPFQAKDNNVTWDGRFNNKVLQPGVYVYFVDFIQDGRNKIRSGDLTIIN